jgi:hypothetical protein
MTEDTPENERRFPILGGRGRTLTSVPWSAVEAAEDQIAENHGSTLDALAKVGGLDARELLAALTGERSTAKFRKMGLPEVEGEIAALIGEA